MNPFAFELLKERTTEELEARLRRLERRDLSRYYKLTWERAHIRRELQSRVHAP